MNHLNKNKTTYHLQIRQMFSASQNSLVVGVLLAAILAYLQSEVIDQTVVVAWFSVVASIALLRAALIIADKRSPTDDHATLHARLLKFRIGVLVSGAVWGSASFLLFPANDPQHQMFLVFMLAGLTSGGVVSFSADLVCAVGYALTVLAPLVIYLFVAGDALSVAMGASVLLYLGFMLVTSRYINKNITENIGLRSEAIAREKIVSASEERYRLLLTHLPVGIFHYDMNFGITYCNNRFAEILHSPVERLIGLNMRLLKDQSVLPALEKALQGESSHYEGQYHATTSDTSGTIEMTCAPSRDSSGNIVGGIAIVQDITERRQTQEELEESKEKYRGLSEAASEAIFISEKGKCIEQNSRAKELLGYSSAEAIGKMGTDWIAPQDRAIVLKNMMDGYELPYEVTALRKDGSTFPAVIIGRMMHYKGRAVRVTSLRDITAQKHAETELRIAAIAFEAQDGLMIADADNKILRVNRSFTDITGYSVEEVVGKNPRILNSGRQDAAFYAAMWDTLGKIGAWEGEIWNRRKNGETYPEQLAITAVKDPDGNVTNYVASLTDITLRKAAEDEIRNLAFYDPLTRLPNRRLLQDRLQHVLASSARSDRKGALLFIDLDNFKALNDNLGHDIGDVLLQQVAQRLQSCVREGDSVARLGGDEFVVILENLSEQTIEAAAQTESVGEKIMDALSQTYKLAAYDYHNTPSIGATLFDGHKQSGDELMKQADIAMYQAKKAGGNTLRFFDPQMQDTITARATLEDDLRKALKNRQFQLYYQVQVDNAQRPFGAEALIRWIHPERGMVLPAQFIPMTEESDLILSIGQWVLETACTQLKAWQQDPRTRDLVLAVNVSAKQFHQADFIALVQAAVTRHALNPNLLKLEITESMLLENIEDTISTMKALKAIGVRLALDDFGTGYSSLQYLKRLPLDQLKIDQSFVSDLATNSSDKTIVSTVIAMAHSLHLDVIAEGVETEDQLQFLLKEDCIHYQGYLFGKPVPIDQFEASL